MFYDAKIILKNLGAVILTKDFLGAVFCNFGGFSGATYEMPQIFPHFSPFFLIGVRLAGIGLV